MVEPVPTGKCSEGERFRRALDEVPIGILLEDADGRVREMNPYLQRLLGIGPIELGTLASIAVPEDARRLHELVARLRAGTLTSFDMEVRVEVPGVGQRIFRKFGARIPSPSLDDWGVVCVLVDITAQREAERLKDEFVAVVSHELRTPLTMILAPLLMLERGQLDPRSEAGREIIGHAVENAKHMTRLVQDIFDLGRLRTGNLTIRPRPLDLTAFLEDEVEARDVGRLAGPAISTEVAPGLRVHADADRLQQVLTNLLDNAIAYSPPGGRIRVAAARRGHEIRVEVADEGPGVPPDQREKVFERFRQLEPARDRSRGGTGLGLTIARSIVEQHGGRIWIEEAPGGGALVAFTLSASDEPTVP